MTRGVPDADAAWNKPAVSALTMIFRWIERRRARRRTRAQIAWGLAYIQSRYGQGADDQ